MKKHNKLIEESAINKNALDVKDQSYNNSHMNNTLFPLNTHENPNIITLIFRNQLSNDVTLLIDKTKIITISDIIDLLLKKLKVSKSESINDFNGFKIEDFKFDGDITKKSAKEIKLFFIRNANKFIFKNTNKQINLIELINQVRNNKYHIQQLNTKNNIPDIFINENSKIFFSLNNIVKINSRKYLFRNKEGEFEKKLHKNDLKIMRIIGMDHLNSIIIIEKNKIEYILIYDENNNSNNESINSINLEVNNTERVVPYRTENNIISSSSEDF